MFAGHIAKLLNAPVIVWSVSSVIVFAGLFQTTYNVNFTVEGVPIIEQFILLR